MIRTDSSISDAMPRSEAIKVVKEYEKNGINAYIVSEDEGNRLKENGNKFNTPKWS
ncbi:hypothetical protein [Alkaliphilus peptidifermentans]|uniref:hypothetical protein n=1 Tax=Alkaliphilus peptidifermentans TaxID=426129 RepID=UPI001FA6DE68|nr:hypothetical protein [Alkaliphilus peptidifermentans]